MGPHFAEVSGNVLWVLALTMLFWPANTSAAGVMLGTSKHKPLVPLLLTEGVCNLALSIVLIKTMGVIGVAWGTAVPSLAVSLVFWPWYVRRSQGVSPLRYVLSSWVRPGLAIVPFGLVTYAIERFWPATGLVLFFTQVAVALPAALVSFWFLCTPAAVRQWVMAKLSSRGEKPAWKPQQNEALNTEIKNP
jgi:O-antigen/teichoic acid export membrane protein